MYNHFISSLLKAPQKSKSDDPMCHSGKYINHLTIDLLIWLYGTLPLANASVVSTRTYQEAQTTGSGYCQSEPAPE